MRKLFTIFGMIILIPVILVVIGLILLSSLPMVPGSYTTELQTGGDIEAKYLAMGNRKVKCTTRNGSDITKNFYIYYPEELTESSSKYPAVVVLNGTGVLPKKYKALFRHLSSWGFIVVGSDDGSAGNGKSADEAIELIFRENCDVASIFYGKIDTENIGITGHSQGGAGVFSALSIAEHKDCYKTAVALSPTHEKTAHQLGWSYDLTQINTPVFMLAGTNGDFETQAVLPIAEMQKMFEKIPTEKVMARRTGADHGQMLYSADGYVTAWFMYYLQNDEAAKALFHEIENNRLYQDQRMQLQ